MCDGDTADSVRDYTDRLGAQRRKLFGAAVSNADEELTVVEVKVPSHGVTIANSGVAALSNCQWLLSSRKRSHPGSLQYMRQREADFNRFSASVNGFTAATVE
tara:strand:- start:802 stop:1110 length:309 start_codon:yes stop_codon:yes gene_type:complete